MTTRVAVGTDPVLLAAWRIRDSRRYSGVVRAMPFPADRRRTSQPSDLADGAIGDDGEAAEGVRGPRCVFSAPERRPPAVVTATG